MTGGVECLYLRDHESYNRVVESIHQLLEESDLNIPEILGLLELVKHHYLSYNVGFHDD